MNKKIDCIKKIIIPILLIIFSIFMTIYKVGVCGKKIVILATILIIIIESLVFYILRKFKNIKIHNLYLIIALVLGIAYIFAFPPSEIPDEGSDYLRALEISKFHLVTKQKGKQAGDYYSKNIAKVMKIDNYNDESKVINLKLKGKKKFMDYANKSLYSFICYIPQSIGIGIAVLLNLSIVAQVMLGKLFNYLVFVLLTYFSIKYIPYKKYLVFFVALLPITLQEATSLAPDSLAIGLSFFLISYILKIRKDNKQITNKQLIILFITSIVISLCKIVYLPLCLLILLIPKKLYKSKKQYLIYNILVISISIILNLLWLKYTSRYLVAFKQSNSSEQLKYILGNPLQYIVIIMRTMDAYLPELILQIVGSYLGTFKIKTATLVVLPALYILIKLIVGEKLKNKDLLNNIEKGFIVFIILSIIILIFTSLYIQWTPLKSNYIEGIQGRYFIPLIVPLSCIFMVNKKENNKQSLIEFTIFENIIALLFIVGTFI